MTNRQEIGVDQSQLHKRKILMILKAQKYFRIHKKKLVNERKMQFRFNFLNKNNFQFSQRITSNEGLSTAWRSYLVFFSLNDICSERCSYWSHTKNNKIFVEIVSMVFKNLNNVKTMCFFLQNVVALWLAINGYSQVQCPRNFVFLSCFISLMDKFYYWWWCTVVILIFF